MVTTEEGTHTVFDGTKLYTKTWKSDTSPRAIVAFVHGFSDHSLASHGIEVRAFDQRGWGRSVTTPKQRGLTGPTSLVLSDIHSFLLSLVPLTKTASPSSPIPLFLMGHSMGGGEVLHYVLNPASPYHKQFSSPNRGQDTVTLKGVLAFSPFVALHPSSRPLGITVVLGRLAGKLLPRFHLRNQLDPKFLCRDEKVCADYVADPLCHETGTLEGLAGLLDRAAWLEKLPASSSSPSYAAAEEAVPPIWIGHGTDDRITSFDATKRFVDVLSARDKTFKVYEGAYHKLHAEPYNVKEQLVKDISDWILERSGTLVSSTSVDENAAVSNTVDSSATEDQTQEVDNSTQNDKAKL
ncbi:Lysophospholipase [Rasamsonia emersonii CBS 393.64]|uniref:Lysophospholipase n=1 Tax=Rasamsonia emersonii (strain ATCC 16479 / CBS 393.64 / IMI 116815) TaxID=1408163 RepID=A0A0F4YTG4_RASE3|nr:Lysophospholipase [Rasamsonia emersonii CBS 393.64]KKA21385.1 Lysophospholipase [Rasamsonia emersonii CBS 393.64]